MAGARRIDGARSATPRPRAAALQRRLRHGAAVQPVGRWRRARSTNCSTACRARVDARPLAARRRQRSAPARRCCRRRRRCLGRADARAGLPARAGTAALTSPAAPLGRRRARRPLARGACAAASPALLERQLDLRQVLARLDQHQRAFVEHATALAGAARAPAAGSAAIASCTARHLVGVGVAPTRRPADVGHALQHRSSGNVEAGRRRGWRDGWPGGTVAAIAAAHDRAAVGWPGARCCAVALGPRPLGRGLPSAVRRVASRSRPRCLDALAIASARRRRRRVVARSPRRRRDRQRRHCRWRSRSRCRASSRRRRAVRRGAAATAPARLRASASPSSAGAFADRHRVDERWPRAARPSRHRRGVARSRSGVGPRLRRDPRAARARRARGRVAVAAFGASLSHAQRCVARARRRCGVAAFGALAAASRLSRTRAGRALVALGRGRRGRRRAAAGRRGPRHRALPSLAALAARSPPRSPRPIATRHRGRRARRGAHRGPPRRRAWPCAPASARGTRRVRGAPARRFAAAAEQLLDPGEEAARRLRRGHRCRPRLAAGAGAGGGSGRLRRRRRRLVGQDALDHRLLLGLALVRRARVMPTSSSGSSIIV